MGLWIFRKPVRGGSGYMHAYINITMIMQGIPIHSCVKINKIMAL